MIDEAVLDSLRENFQSSLEGMNRSIKLGLNNHCADNTTAKYLIIQLFEIHNSLGIELTDDEIDILTDTALHKRVCC